MAKHKVNILIQASDKASKKLMRIGKAAFGMGGLLRKAAAAAALYFGGRAMYRFTKSTVEAAAKQEEAHALLIQSLKNVGAQYDAIFPRLKQFSSEVQQVTKFGDEEVQQLMSLGLNLGLTTDKLEEATKGAIGLRSIMGGKLGLTESMKYLALAYQGEFTMLRRYIPELRKTEDAIEQLAIVQKKGIEGFKLAREEALRGLGPLQQMKNAVGDVKEKIGGALLPTVQETALRIKEWCERNQDKIGEWAEISVAAVTLVKDSFIDFLDYMRTDWKNSMSFALDSFLTLLLTAFKTAVSISIAGGQGIWAGLKQGLAGQQPETHKLAQKLYEAAGGQWGTRIRKTPPGGIEPLATVQEPYAKNEALWQQSYANAKKQAREKTIKDIVGDVPQQIAKQWKDAFGEIMASAPEGLGGAWQKSLESYQARIAEISAKYFAGTGTPGPEGVGGTGAGPGGPLAGLITTIQGKLSPKEGRLLTFAPGQAAQEDPGFKIERNTSEQLRVVKESLRTLDIIRDFLDPSRGSSVLPSAVTLRAAGFEG